MAEVYTPSWGAKDADDVRTKNFDAAGALYDEGNPTVTSYSVFVDAARGCADGALVISNVAWNPTLKRLSFSWSGGTPGQTYVVTGRVAGAGFSIDQSASVVIGQK
jgi:hypothetical protein